MERSQRERVAGATREHLDAIEQQVVDSWDDLVPMARAWGGEQLAAARRALRAAFAGVARVIEDGDLDDRSWGRLRDDVLAHGRLSVDEAAQLLRSVRVAGVEAVLGLVPELDPDARQDVQARVDAFCDQLFSERPQPDPGDLDRLLADLERDGPDLG